MSTLPPVGVNAHFTNYAMSFFCNKPFGKFRLHLGPFKNVPTANILVFHCFNLRCRLEQNLHDCLSNLRRTLSFSMFFLGFDDIYRLFLGQVCLFISQGLCYDFAKGVFGFSQPGSEGFGFGSGGPQRRGAEFFFWVFSPAEPLYLWKTCTVYDP